MDRNSPDYYIEDTEQSLDETVEFTEYVDDGYNCNDSHLKIFNITFDTTLDERDVQDVAKLERTVDDAYYRGVTWNSRKQRWTARLLTDGKSLSIGYFQHEKDAITASDHYQDAKWGGR